MSAGLTFEDAAKLLTQSRDFRVLRRLGASPKPTSNLSSDALVGIIVDVETTGLDQELDEIIELAMVKFKFERNGSIGKVIETFQSFNEPVASIPSSVTLLTGITDLQVEGQTISKDVVSHFISDAVLIIAHNASFDRPFCERLIPQFAEVAWACSATEIPWRDEGIVGTRLEYIAQAFGFFYEAHRATDDCLAVHEILSFSLPRSQDLALAALLSSARRTEARIFATGASYDLRILLKKRGYRWNGALNQYPRAWWRDVDPAKEQEEISFLGSLDRTIEPEIFLMTAKNRFRGLPR